MSQTVAKRLTAARFAGVPELEAAFTDYSDASDISDGDGVRPPHQGRYVELLQQSLLDMGYGLSHGVTGVYTEETKNTVMKLQVDAGHPLHAGHDWEHIGGIGGPNTLAHFDMFDPGGTVGSHSVTATGAAADVARFAESPDHPFAGFDGSTSPPSLVVGVNTRRRVAVRTEPAGAHLAFRAEPQGVVTIGRTHEGIVVGGERVGSAMIEAYSGSSLVASLAVTVKPMRRETVNFFFVRDSGSISTARTEDQATLLTLRLNRVWRRQANVLFSLGQVQSVSGSRFAELEGFAISGQFNVFCLADGATVMGSSSVAFLSDADCGDKMDVAHAAGRYLGFTGPDANDGLMAACGSGAERRRVSRMLADIVNP